jgi:hypothetical protein
LNPAESAYPKDLARKAGGVFYLKYDCRVTPQAGIPTTLGRRDRPLCLGPCPVREPVWNFFPESRVVSLQPVGEFHYELKV